MLTWQLDCVPVTPGVPMQRPRDGWEAFAVGLVDGVEHVYLRRSAMAAEVASHGAGLGVPLYDPDLATARQALEGSGRAAALRA